MLTIGKSDRFIFSLQYRYCVTIALIWSLLFMRILALVLRLLCFGFALFLLYQVIISLYSNHYILMDIVANIGTILICIDLGVFLSFNKLSKLFNANEPAASHQALVPSRLEQLTRKLGHLGIMLIICSWVVPLI